MFFLISNPSQITSVAPHCPLSLHPVFRSLDVPPEGQVGETQLFLFTYIPLRRRSSLCFYESAPAL